MRKSAKLANTEASERRSALNIRVADLVQVTAYHPDKRTVDVKPMVQREIAGAYVSPPPILSVKVAAIPYKITVDVTVDGKTGTGTGTAEPDIKAGDMGVVLYLDLDSDHAIMAGEESPPNSSRIHSGDDAIFVGVVTPG